MEYIQQFSFLLCLLLILFGNWLNPAVAFALPWTFMLGASQINLTLIQRDLSDKTLFLIASNIAIGFLINLLFKFGKSRARRNTHAGFTLLPNSGFWLRAFTAVAALIALISVVYSGGLPLVTLITGVGPIYQDFGIPSLNGFLVALINCLCCIAFALYLLSGKRSYLYYILAFLSWQFLVISRGNLFLLSTELAVVYFNLKQKSPKKVKALMIGAVLFAIFTVLGNLRSGDIREASGVDVEAASKYPNALVWLYMYSASSVYSIDSVINVNPRLGLSFMKPLLPTVLRGDNSDSESSIERWQDAAVVSYIAPIYEDIGFWGVLGFTSLVLVLTFYYYYRALFLVGPLPFFIYSVLYSCAFWSFFSNFWFFLPVIFQVILFSLIARLFFKGNGKTLPSTMAWRGGMDEIH